MANAADFRPQRRQLFVDRNVQGALLGRAVTYWLFSLLTIVLMLFCWRIMTGPAMPFVMHAREMWLQFGPALCASLLLVPIVLVDVLRLSNKFVGPMIRVRRMVQQMAKGEPVQRVQFRDGDYWHGFAADLSAVVTRMERLSEEAAHSQIDAREFQELIGAQVTGAAESKRQ